jgi:hypothetical protein
VTTWAERRRDADSEWRMERFTAESVACPRCLAVPRADGAPDRPDQHCRNAITGLELRAPAHDARIRAARESA